MCPVSLGKLMLLFASTHRVGEKLWDSLCSCTALLTHPSLLVQWLYLHHSNRSRRHFMDIAEIEAALKKLYVVSKTESRAGFPHFRNAAEGETTDEA